ncbi:MAG: ThuA domain-containing protein [Bacteroidales bacterium]|nr:ThuA domain-containing protein [Bacteroidales bacterium]
MQKIILNWLFLFLFSLPAFCQSGSDKIEVLIVDGFSNHDWKQTTNVVKTILEESGLFSVSLSTSPSEPEDEAWKSWKPAFENFSVVILNSNNIHNKEIRWPENIEKRLEDYVKSGGGLYVLHSANNAFADWPEYNLMIGLGWRSPGEGVALQVADNGQIVKIPVGEGKATYHGPRHDEVIYILNDHPINDGFPKAWKTPDMELYKFARGPAKNLTVLSYARDHETNINWPVEWTVDYGKGRVYNSSMGHLWKGDSYPVSLRCIGFQTTLIRATEWLGTGKTSYPLPDNFPSESDIRMVEEN